MRCRDVQAALPEYLDRALPEAKRELLAAHLAECGECRREHAAHERAAHALSVAVVAPPGDLWQSLQARLNAEPPLATCEEVRKALPEWVDGVSGSLTPRLIADHLDRCRTCAAEERRLLQALERIDRVGRSAAVTAPDLWSAFSAKLAATISCAEMGERLPAYLAGERSAASLAIEQHLEHCAHCEAAAADYSAALGALDRTARTQAQPDLWASMAARVADESPLHGGRNPAWLQALARQQSWRTAAAGAALIAAAVVVAAFVFRGREQAANTPLARVPGTTTIAAAPMPMAVDGSALDTEPEGSSARNEIAAETHDTAPAAAEASPRGASRARRAVAARRRPMAPSPLRVAKAEAPRMARGALAPPAGAGAGSPDWSHKLEVTFDVKQSGVRVASAQPTESATGPEEKKIEAEVIHAAKMLVSIDDAASRPFEMKADGN